DRALDGDPGHQPRVDEVLLAAPGLPDAFVAAVPVLADPLDEARELAPGLVVYRLAVLVVEVDGVHQLAVDVELELLRGAVPDPDGRRPAVALEVRQLELLEVGAPVDPVHDLERPGRAAVRLAHAVGQPAHEALG